MSCGSCCSRSSRDNRDVLSRFKTWLCTRYEGQVQPLYFSRNPNPTLGREISAHRPWSLSNCQARLLFLYRLRNMQENFLRGTRCLAHSWTQIPATQMQSHIIKRPLSPGELVVGGDAHTHAVPVQTPSEQGSSQALTAIGLSRHFPAMSSGPHVWIFFPEDFGKIAPAFPCMFQSELHGVPEPGGSEPGKMHDSQGMPGLDEGRRALWRAGSGAGQAAASSRGCQRHSDQIKAIPAPAAHCSFPNYVDC